MKDKGFVNIPLIIVLVIGVLGVGGLLYKDKVLTKPKQTSIASASPMASANIEPEKSPTATPSNTFSPVQSTTPTPSSVSKPELSVMIMGKNSKYYSLFINWKNVQSPTSGDWLGVYPYGEKGDNPLSERIYVTGCTIKSQMEIADGFSKPGMEMGGCPLPLELDPGEYEVRLYRNDTTERIATSPTFSAK